MAIADVLLTNVYYHACVAESKCQYLQEFLRVRLEGFEPPTRGLGNRCSIP